MVAAGKKPADLALAAELDDSQMSKVLSGRAGLSLYSLRRVADALGCTRADILSAADAAAAGRAARGSRRGAGDLGGSKGRHGRTVARPSTRT